MFVDKEEYDNLKYIEHEYNNLKNEIFCLIKNVDDLQSGELKFDNEEVARIIKRYFRIKYDLKKGELKNE